MPIDTEQWRAQTGLFCASRVLLRPPRGKQPQPKVQANTLSLNMRFSLAVLLVTLRTGIFYASQTLQLLWLIACRACWLLSSVVRLSCRRLRGVSVLLALCLVVVQMLLIMSGDVEENPGPPKIRTNVLGVSDLSCVFEELLDVSHKWFNLGLKLKLSVGFLERVRNQYPDLPTALREMLLHWLMKVDPPPTWEGLACALESRTVGDPRLAEHLRTKYCRTEGAAGGSVGQTVAATEEEQPSHPSRHIRRLLPAISAGGLVRPELQTVSSKESHPHHSRHARVVPPSRRLPSTTSRPLTRNEVDPLDQQRKPLVVGGQTPDPHPPIYGPVPSSPAHTPVDQYASYLRAVYTSKKLPTYSKWPPSSSKKFIHLAVVRKERVGKNEADAFTRATIRGTEIDDIYRKKAAVDFSRVGKMKDGSLAKLILVEGAPGIGKTTFAWEVCRKWASGEILQEYGLVVLLRLRDKRVREVTTVFDLFYHANPELCNAVGKEILDHEGESVLLLYEGYDELPRKLQEQQSIFLDVLHKKDLPRATILITSRPSATGYLRLEFKERISQHIEILGFTKDDIISYVHDVIEDEQVCKDFFQYLKCYPYIGGMMYVPLNAVIVTEVYKDSQQSPEKFIPTTMTELYTALTRSLLLRYLHSHSEYGQQVWNLKCITDLPKELYEHFCEVTAVALKGMMEDTFVFDDLPNDFNTLDLMQSVSELYIAQGASMSHNFFHLTLQEYLAAVNISQQPVEKQIKFFQTSDPIHDRPSKFRRPLVHRAMPHSQPPHPIHDRPSTFGIPRPLVHRARKSRLQPLHSRTSHHQKLSSSQPPSTTSTPPQHSKLNPHAKPFIPQHQFSTPGASPTLLHSPTVAPSNSHPSLATVPRPRGLSTSLDQPLVPHQYFPTSKYPSTQYSYPHPAVTPPTPRMTHPFSQMMSTHTGDLKGGCTHHSTHPTLPLGTMDPESSVPTSVARLGTTHDSFESDDGSSPIPNTTTVPQLGSRASLTQLSLPDINVPGISTRLRNVLRFVAGLTRFKGISLASLQQQLLVLKAFSHDIVYSDRELSLTSLHWLFESQCSETYNELLSPYRLLTKGRSSMLPFDYFVLGYAMAHITSHWEINLSHSEIGDEEMEMLVAGVIFKRDKPLHSGENRALQQLDISSNSIGERGTTVLADVLKKNGTLQRLDISSNSIGDEGATALAEMLKENRTLQQLDVSSNSIGSRGATALAKMLKENRTLQQLDISSNCIGIRGSMALAEMLKKNRTLQQLDVSNNFIGDGGAMALAEMLKENRTLQQLRIMENSIGNNGAIELAKMLKENRTLQQLDVRNNFIGDGGATALAEMLKENRTIQQLTISCNSIGEGGATALAEMLKENRTLQQLSVGFNSIGDRGATALAEMLKKNRTLQQLDISSNCIGIRGSIALAKMLKENRAIQQLDIGNNSIGDRGATALAEMLKMNRTLQQLIVSNNSIGVGGATALAEMLKRNRTLQQLIVSNNSIGVVGATALAEMLENRTLQLDATNNATSFIGNIKLF